ncbi:MAG: hypothetical protein E4H13_02670 [Calditrichales bacterium]|nr:MAG: hypothetical protein E4H13_02670 [Calditrichales bacterium]
MRRIIFLLFLPLVIHAQDLSLLEPLRLIDTPTAGTLMRGSFRAETDVYPSGGILAGISAGISNRFMFGLSYGGTNMIGVGEVDWNKQIGATVRYRLFEEDFVIPAILLGYDSQGYGAFLDSTNRYINKSMGLFAAVSKNFQFLGILGLHGGVNYSFEKDDKDKDLNVFAGIEKSINPELVFVAEYDFAFNDDAPSSVGRGKGYLNAGLKWAFAGKLEISFVLKDIFKNRRDINGISREIRIAYAEIF